jgi:hypothetical protein
LLQSEKQNHTLAANPLICNLSFDLQPQGMEVIPDSLLGQDSPSQVTFTGIFLGVLTFGFAGAFFVILR